MHKPCHDFISAALWLNSRRWTKLAARAIGNTRGINPNFAAKIRRELDALDNAITVSDLDVPGFGLHPLKGNRKGEWALTVSRNYRITFRFEDGDACDVNLEDYH